MESKGKRVFKQIKLERDSRGKRGKRTAIDIESREVFYTCSFAAYTCSCPAYKAGDDAQHDVH